MAITFTNLGVSTGTTPQAPDIRNIGDATSYTIPSWDPPDDGIVVLCILNGENAGNIFLDSVTGNGDVWEFIADLSYPTGAEIRQMNVVAAYGADLTTGATLIDFAGATQINCYVSIFHITGADESGLVVDAFALPPITGDGTSTTVTIDFPTPLDADNRAFAFVAHNANEVVSIDAGSTTWTELDDMNGAGPALGMITAFDTAAGPNDPNFDWTTSAAYGFIGIEVKIAPPEGPAETPKFTRPGRRVPKALVGPRFLLDDDEILYTVPAGIRTLVRFVHFSNLQGSDARLAIGDSNVAANIIILITESEVPYRNYTLYEWLEPGETLRGYATSLNDVVIRIDGYERPAG